MKALALALTYIPGYSNHLENVTSRASWGGAIVMTLSAWGSGVFHLPASPSPTFSFGAFSILPMPLFIPL